MRICYPPDGVGCHIVISEGYFEGFNDEHPQSNLRGLTGATLSFDKDLQLTHTHYRNGDEDTWRGPYFDKVIDLVRDWAQDQTPPKVSGVFPAFKLTESQPPPAMPAPIALHKRRPHPAPIPREEPDVPKKNPDLEYLGNHYVVRRRKAG